MQNVKFFLKCIFASFLCVFIVSISCFSVFAVVPAVAASVGSIIVKYLGEEFLEAEIGSMFDALEAKASGDEYDLVQATFDNFVDVVTLGGILGTGVHIPDKLDELASGLSNVPVGLSGAGTEQKTFRADLRDKLKREKTKKLVDFSNGYNVDVDLDTYLQTVINKFIKDKFDIFAYADDKVSNVINDFEDFENTDLSILYNLLSTCNTDFYNIVTCGKGYFCVMGQNYRNLYFPYLNGNYGTNVYYFSPDGYIFWVASQNGYSSMPGSFCYFRKISENDDYLYYFDEYGNKLKSATRCSNKNTYSIFSSDNRSYYISEVSGKGYALFDSNDDIISDYYVTLSDCYYHYFLALDADTFVPSEIDLQYYPSASDATEEKKIVVNNTYNYNTTTEQIYNYDAVGTLASTVTDNDTDIVQSNGNTNITINNNNINNSNDLSSFGSALGSLDFSSVKIENFSDLLDTFQGYLDVLKQACSVLPDSVWGILSVGIGSAVLLRIFGR